MPYETHVVLDFEFNPTAKENRSILRQEIIEIGAVKLNSRLEEIGRFSCYVRPELADHISPEITRLTDILRRLCSREFYSDLKKAKNAVAAETIHSTYSVSGSSCGAALQELMLRLKSA